MPLLTLIVPTYKRADSLELLLTALRAELASTSDEVAVIVTDNASPDRTPEVTAAAQAAWPSLVVQRHARNLGPDDNFCSAVDRVASRYFWIISDDDMPKRGVIAQILALLKKTSPALVYMDSEWINPVTGPDQGTPVGALRFDVLDGLAFARQVHVWVTFISGMVVDHELLLRQLGKQTIRRFHGSSLVQLGWVLPLLQADARFVHVYDRCVLATKDNSGGYPLLTVFGARFARIVNDTLGRDSPLARTLVRGNILRYLPGRIWVERISPSAGYEKEDPWPAMRDELRTQPLFWLLLLPLVRFPRWLAQPFYQAWRVFHRLDRERQAARARVAQVSGARAE